MDGALDHYRHGIRTLAVLGRARYLSGVGGSRYCTIVRKRGMSIMLFI